MMPGCLARFRPQGVGDCQAVARRRSLLDGRGQIALLLGLTTLLSLTSAGSAASSASPLLAEVRASGQSAPVKGAPRKNRYVRRAERHHISADADEAERVQAPISHSGRRSHSKEGGRRSLESSTTKKSSPCRSPYFAYCEVAAAAKGSLLQEGFTEAPPPVTPRSRRAVAAAMQQIKELPSAVVLDKKPKGSPRTYQHAWLENGLEVVNIFDKASKQAAFSVAVTTGLFYDPGERSGLAHLTEHALFLGTRGYPQTDGFDRYLTKYGGSSNAYTEEEVTVYYAGLDAAGFEQGMDRFADFFRDPLLNASSVYKEVSAVHSEHSKNIQSATWRTERAMKSIANPESPLQRFHTGDRSSLTSGGASALGEAIRKFFNANYCPPRMRLATIGPDPLEVQLRIAQQAFGNISRTGYEGKCKAAAKSFAQPAPFPQERLGKFLHADGASVGSELWLLFPLQSLTPFYKSHPILYINYMLSYVGDHSLSRELRDAIGVGGAVELFAEDSSAGTMVWVVVSLLNKGAERPDAVLDTLFTFFERVRSQGVNETILSSLALAAQLGWDWPALSDPSTEASSIAEEMTRLKPAELLSADSLYLDPNPDHIIQVLDMLRPQNVNVGMVDSEWANYRNSSLPVQVVEHYNMSYTEARLEDVYPNYLLWGGGKKNSISGGTESSDQELYQRLLAIGLQVNKAPNISIPGAITGFPSKESLLLTKAEATRGNRSTTKVWGVDPVKLDMGSSGVIPAGGDTKALELWYRRGWVLPQPKVIASFTFRTAQNLAEELSARQALLLMVGGRILAEDMERRLANLGRTGAWYSVSQWSRGLSVVLGAFEERLPALADKVLMEYNRGVMHGDAYQFKRIVSETLGELQDDSKMPLTRATMDFDILLNPRTHSSKELLAARHSFNLTRQAVARAMAQTRQQPLASTAFIMGSYTETAAKTLLNNVLGHLNVTVNVSLNNVERVLPVVDPPAPVEVRKKNPRPGDKNHVTYVSVLLGVGTVEQRVLLGLVAFTLSELIFSELRTKRELGYIVGGRVAQTSNVMYVTCYVQGEKMLPDDVEALCEWIFSKALPDRLASMTAEGFAARKEAYSSAILERPLSISEEEGHFESPILLGGCTELHTEMLAYLETVTSPSQLLDAWVKAVTPANGTRKKVVVKYWGAGVAVPPAPTGEEMYQKTLAKGSNSSAGERMRREREATLVYHSVNSTVRSDLVQKKGYYPTTLKCSRGGGAAASSSEAASGDKVSPAMPTAPLFPLRSEPSADKVLPAAVSSQGGGAVAKENLTNTQKTQDSLPGGSSSAAGGMAPPNGTASHDQADEADDEADGTPEASARSPKEMQEPSTSSSTAAVTAGSAADAVLDDVVPLRSVAAAPPLDKAHGRSARGESLALEEQSPDGADWLQALARPVGARFSGMADAVPLPALYYDDAARRRVMRRRRGSSG
eukprot:TRINITY_DN37904_c0_g1_i1.p1 TRINITY_DN37904_c0_g1~~TRINITY_DN37904_c0_g1_i1.p1  ORF type:complete len:1442 (-),score=342.33 TRINITY_DN37904_c0_g1_i1:212-4537(-)